MDVSHIISKSLQTYDEAKPVVSYLKGLDHHIVRPSNPDVQRPIYRFSDKLTNEVILETECELLAIYYKKYSIWSWAWANTSLSDGETYYAKKLVSHAITLKPEMSYVKSLLITSRGLINDPVQLDINIAIGSGVIKQPYIFPVKYQVTHEKNDDIYHYVILLNKPDLDAMAEKIKNDAK